MPEGEELRGCGEEPSSLEEVEPSESASESSHSSLKPRGPTGPSSLPAPATRGKEGEG